MPLSHFLLALFVVFIWGTNFVVIKWGLAELPPLLFAALRFFFSALPGILVFRRPAVAWRTLAIAGLFVGTGQFGLLYWAMREDISPGLASLVIQSQVFFTIAMSVALRGERLRAMQWAALALATAGYLVVAWRSAFDPAALVTPTGLLMVLGSAFCWSCANVVVGRLGRVDMLGFVSWNSLFAMAPLLLLSLAVEGPAAIAHAMAHAGWAVWLSVLWQALVNTLLCFAAWNWLLARHPAASVVSMALLVPVFGIVGSAWLLGEPLPPWKLAAAGLVLAGLAANLYGSRARGLKPGA